MNDPTGDPTADPTTDPQLRSFVDVAETGHFPIQNLPFGVFRPKGKPHARVGVAIGDQVLDLALLETRGLFDGPALRGHRVFDRPALNDFLALGRPAWREARGRISRLLSRDEPTLRDDASLRALAFTPQDQVEMLLPAQIGDYTDFYSSREHATNVGIMFRGPDNALMPNWLHMPIAYHGRASSVVASGARVLRPRGQSRPDEAQPPIFGPSRALDFELELGFLIGPSSALGSPIPLERTVDHIFGCVLVNDWSARDLQKWEYQPLGPFLAKNFATSISPWVVTLEALAPFRCAGPTQDPEPMEYLREGPAEPSRFDLALQVELQTARMRAGGHPSAVISQTNAKLLYWSMRQQLAHHTVNGCDVRSGDLMASGTISGSTKDSRGSLLELAWRGTDPISLPGGEARAYLEDGDSLVLTGWAQGAGYRVGFGQVEGTIQPAVTPPSPAPR